MLKIGRRARQRARGQRPAAGLTPARGYSCLYMMVVPSSRCASCESRLKPGMTPTVTYPSEA